GAAPHPPPATCPLCASLVDGLAGDTGEDKRTSGPKGAWRDPIQDVDPYFFRRGVAMEKRSWAAAMALVCGAFVLAWALAGNAADDAKTQPAKESKTKDLFGLTKVHRLHLELTAKEWEKMQAVSGGMRFPGGPGGPRGPGGPGGPGEKPGEKPA